MSHRVSTTPATYAPGPAVPPAAATPLTPAGASERAVLRWPHLTVIAHRADDGLLRIDVAAAQAEIEHAVAPEALLRWISHAEMLLRATLRSPHGEEVSFRTPWLLAGEHEAIALRREVDGRASRLALALTDAVRGACFEVPIAESEAWTLLETLRAVAG